MAASRCFMFIYFLLPHWVPATWRRRAQTSMRAEFPEAVKRKQHKDSDPREHKKCYAPNGLKLRHSASKVAIGKAIP